MWSPLAIVLLDVPVDTVSTPLEIDKKEPGLITPNALVVAVVALRTPFVMLSELPIFTTPKARVVAVEAFTTPLLTPSDVPTFITPYAVVDAVGSWAASWLWVAGAAPMSSGVGLAIALMVSDVLPMVAAVTVVFQESV